MLPVLIKIGPFTLRTYGLMYASGVLFGLLIGLRLARRDKIDGNQYLDFAFYTVLVSIFGAKLFLVLTNLDFYSHYPAELKGVLLSGGTFYGGLILGIPFASWYIHRKKLPFRSVGDATMTGLALGHFFGRLGCFAAGCCFGRPASGFPLAVTFSSEKASSISGVPLHMPLYPTQLAEAILNLLNFIFLYWLFARRKFPGQVLVFYLLNYSVIRFILEYFRGDPDRGYIFGAMTHPFSSLSVSQLISIFGLILAAAFFFAFRKKGE